MGVIHLDSAVTKNSSLSPAILGLGLEKPGAMAGGQSGIFAIADRYAADRRVMTAGVELFAEGEASDSLYVVLDGWLILHRILEDGRRQILDFALPGAVLGYRAGPEASFSFTAETITRAEVAVIPLSRLNALLCEGSDCSLTLLAAMNEALMGAFDSLTDVGRRTAREAVAHFLLRMDQRIRQIGQGIAGDAVPFPLTQEHIGDALGLTAVHVCRTLRALRADGLVETGGGRLFIADVDALADEAGVYNYNAECARLAS